MIAFRNENMKYILTALLCLMTSCQHTGSDTQAQVRKMSLEHKVDIYWQAWIAEDWEAVLEMTDPEIREQSASRIQSMAESPMAQYLDYNRLDVRKEGNQAQVKYELRIKYLHPLLASLPPQDQVFVDIWVERNGVWYKSMHRPKTGEVKNLFQSLQGHKGGDE